MDGWMRWMRWMRWMDGMDGWFWLDTVCMYWELLIVYHLSIFEIRTVVMKMKKDMKRTHATFLTCICMYITFIP